MRDVLLLVRHRTFSLLWLAGLISLTGDWLLGVALPIYVFRLTGSPAATAAVVAASVTSSLVAGSVAGVLVDRWDRRRVLIVANLAQVAVILPLLAVTSADRVWIVLVVAALESALGQFVAPAEHALLPRLVDPADLPAANSLNTLNRNIARLIGPALGAVVASTIGLSGAAVLDAVSFALAAVLVAVIGGTHRAVAAEEVRLPRRDRVGALARWRHELIEGLRAVRGSTVLRALLAVLLVTSVGEGIMGSLFAVFASRGLAGGATDIGWLMSAQAVGGIAGGLASAALARRLRPVVTLVVAQALFGLVDLVIFNLPRFTPALAPQIALFVLVGIPGAFSVAAAMTMLQREVGDALRGRVFAAFTVAQSGGALLGSAVAATLTDRFGVLNVLTAQGAGYVLASGLFVVLLRRGRRDRRDRRGRRPAAPVRARDLLGRRELVTSSHSIAAMQRRWNA